MHPVFFGRTPERLASVPVGHTQANTSQQITAMDSVCRPPLPAVIEVTDRRSPTMENLVGSYIGLELI